MKTNLREKYDKKRKDRESEFGKYMAMPATGPESKPPEAMEVAWFKKQLNHLWMSSCSHYSN